MHLVRFRFRDTYLEANGECFDLHNCFDFGGFTYDVSTRVLRLRWLPNEYGPADEHRRIDVEFHGVSHLSIEPRDSALPFSEDDCLSFVAYASPGSAVGEAIGCEQPTPDMHLVFCFMSEMRLRVYADHAHVTLNTDCSDTGGSAAVAIQRPCEPGR